MRETVTLARQGVLDGDDVNPLWVQLLDLSQMNLSITISMESLC
jgi:hypothetical protein